MKVLLLNGSPHEEGCTYTALSAVAEALRESGVDTEMEWIGEEPISGCTACGGCAKLTHCARFDDCVPRLQEKAAAADGLVIGSPVYFAAPNGTLLAALDRMFYGRARGLFRGKPAAAVVSARRAGTTASLEVLHKYFMIAEMPLVSSKYWCMVHGNRPEEVRQDLEGMQIMRQLGRNMAWLLKSIEAGRDQGLAMPAQEPAAITNFIR